MNRREVITIIVIVNFVLLSVLFMTGERLEQLPAQSLAVTVVPEPEVPKRPAPIVVQLPPEPPPETAFDEVDAVLRDFAAAVSVTHHRQQEQPINTVAPTIQQERPYVEVTVKRGDFLERIARQNHTSVDEIKRYNELTNDHLKIGQVLRIPLQRPIAPPITRTETATTEGEMYQVKSGDNPWKIAKQCHVSLEELLRLNGLDQESARNLKPGDIIRVR